MRSCCLFIDQPVDSPDLSALIGRNRRADVVHLLSQQTCWGRDYARQRVWLIVAPRFGRA